MTDYQKYINALRKCAKEHENDRTSTGHIIVSDMCRDTANLLETLEQECTGTWIEVPINNFKCSCCGEYACDDYDASGTPKHYKFCPNCGAKMVEQESEEV